MDPSLATEIVRETMIVITKASAPILIVSMLIGLIIAIFQAATQIHEQTITFVPKLLVTGLMLLATCSWMLTLLSDLVIYIFDLMITVV